MGRAGGRERANHELNLKASTSPWYARAMDRRCAGLLLVVALGVAACGGRLAPLKRTGPKVLLIGVDAATWHVLDPMMERGDLPNFKALVDRGAHGTLLSMDPMVSPALWTTIATGTFPERHNVQGFIDEDPVNKKQTPISSNMRKRESLWTIMTNHQRTVNVVGWYASWPAEEVRGNVVTDHFLPRAASAYWPVSEEEEKTLGGRTYPRDLLKEIVPLVPTMEEVAKLDGLTIKFKDHMPENAHLAKLFEPNRVDETRVRVIEYLMKKTDADLDMVFLWGIDPMSHLFWKFYEPDTWKGEPIDPFELAANKDRIPNYYKKIDRYVGDLVAKEPADTIVVIVSDHGFGPATGLSAEGLALSGDHRKEGIILAAGGPIRKGVRVDGASVVDVTPTILYLLGMPVGADMDGRVIEGLFDTPLPRPVETIPTYEPKSPRVPSKPIPSPIDDDILKQLKSLGYVQ